MFPFGKKTVKKRTNPTMDAFVVKRPKTPDILTATNNRE